MLRYETSRFTVFEEQGRLAGREKDHRVLKDDRAVLVRKLGPDVDQSIADAFDRIGASSLIQAGDRVAIKINLGGGIHYVPSTYSDPAICEAIILAVKRFGAEPFVCEADMRAHVMNDRMLRVRGYADMLKRNGVEFVNLSRGPVVRMECRDLDIPLDLPEVLLDPAVKIVSFAPPKPHWECGVTASQKNMYGAIANFRKSIYHRKYERIDHAVAAAARMMSPDLSILATRALCGGVGPHFAIPIRFDRLIIAKDMLRADKAAADILGYPYDQVRYAQINAAGEKVSYDLAPGSDWPEPDVLLAIMQRGLRPRAVRWWKRILYPQYFVPDWVQINAYPPFEFLLTWFNQRVLAHLAPKN